jgi:superfamily II DNA or RNA helicase/HKD family nuclease
LANPLEPGLHEALLTEAVHEARLAVERAGGQVEVGALDPAELPRVLARHVEHVVRRALGVRGVDPAALVQSLLARVGEFSAQASAGEAVHGLSEVRAVHAQAGRSPVRRPSTPLSSSAIFTNGPDEPSIGGELRRELESADRVDLLMAFVKVQGLRLIDGPVGDFLARGGTFRVISSTYLGATDRKALDRLVELGAEVRVAYESNRTRLHAKAWLFHRATGYSTAYVGSSNLSQSAMVQGLEWNVRLAAAESPHLFEKFRATFEAYWAGGEFETYDPERFDAHIQRQRQGRVDGGVRFDLFDIRPLPHQQEMLDRLEAERKLHDRWRNLVVAATGTGKTVLAALDFRRVRAELGDPTLLFVAHRKEILEQSLHTFRGVLRDNTFGELLVDAQEPTAWRHVFASIQTLARRDLDPRQFAVIIVDEFHHAAADTYDRFLNRMEPTLLVGLTATPERHDGRSVTARFHDRFAVELRLWEALDRELLCPFHYFGINDEVDLRAVKWARGGYDTSGLENLYTGNDIRVRLVLDQLRQKVADIRAMRALGFCVSIAHAEFMARCFQMAGVPALAVSSSTPRDARDSARSALELGTINAIFTVDLYNEGVDIPRADTILLLRPTESPTVFLQQLGRGLRSAPDKACCTVLDFIGQQHRSFRFDLRFRALTGVSRRELVDAIEAGFPRLPAGCHIQLDRVAREHVLANVRAAVPTRRDRMAAELRDLSRDVGLGDFLHATMLDLEDVYRTRGWTWLGLRRLAGLPAPGDGVSDELAKAVAGLLHVDDSDRLTVWRRELEREAPPDVERVSPRTRRLLTMLHFLLRGVQAPVASLQASLDALWGDEGARAELRELLALLDGRTDHLTHALGDPLGVPLRVHGRYTRDEVLAAFDYLQPTAPISHREGVYFDKATGTDVFFITLEKSETHFSPTTRYEDYPLARDRFHWQSQNATSRESATGRRYLGSREGLGPVLLFVRLRRKDDRQLTAPYLFLGPARLESAEGDRPISIVWRLTRPMPAETYERAKVVGG